MIKKELSQKQQATEMIREKSNFLIVSHVNPDGDALASALSLKLVLEKMGKTADVAMPDIIADEYAFLPSIDKLVREKKLNRDLVINFKSKVGKISYDKNPDGSINLIISPAQDEIKEEDVFMTFGKSNYEAIIFLDCPNRERANDFYGFNKEFLKDLPSINIDHHPTNIGFGAVNVVDPTATSTCEIVFSLIEALDKTLIDDEVATLLLTGIISDTNRFQNTNTTPKSLTVAAQLIATGARRSDIIKNIFRTKSISTLKLWGKVLSGIQEDKTNKIVWSTISTRDINELGANATQVEGVNDELLSTAPGANIVLMLTERAPGHITGSMRTMSDTVELDKLALSLGGGGHKKAAGFKIENMSLAEAEKIILPKLRAFLSENVVHSYVPAPEVVEKHDVVFDFSKSGTKTITEPKKEAPTIPEPIIAKKPSKDEDFYAPSVSDINLEQPEILEEKTSILQKLLEDKKKKQKEELDFSKLEQEARRKNNPGQYTDSDIDKISGEDDFDEDYE